MSNIIYKGLPPQLLPYKSKGDKWRKSVIDWADNRASILNYSPVRNSVRHKKINYDLIHMKLHKEDILYVLNPHNMSASFIPDNIQHYPVINSKLRVLLGEAISRMFDYHVVVTNPNAISEIENQKRDMIYQSLQLLMLSESLDEDEFNKRLLELGDYFSYQYLDMREVRANELLKHYIKEYNLKNLFDDKGIMDAMIAGEELYQCDIVGGEPTIERLDPLKVRVYRNGYSNRVEDADMVVIEDYWSAGKIYDRFYDALKPKDRKYIEDVLTKLDYSSDSSSDYDERFSYMSDSQIGDLLVTSGHFFSTLLGDGYTDSLLPYDEEGNFRVLRVYWKSRRKIKKVKSYDPETGEEVFHFYPETYIINKELGEEEEIFWINEAWEGTKIGSDIYVNIRPRPILYNSISNPSRCHFGIVGQIYNINNSKPLSFVDILKPYSYLYDSIVDTLFKLISDNLGKLTKLDLSLIPSKWEVDKWLYFAKVNHIAVVNSFNEGYKGASTGKLAGALNNNTSGVIDASVGNEIQYNILLLEWIKNEMSEACGVSKQREGLISNRETVGGVERSTLLSSHITEWIFTLHDDLKRRALECFLETAKIAMKGRNNIKFQYITSEGSLLIMLIDGDEFAECDYGLIVENSEGYQLLNQKLDTLALAALLNQLINFSTMMKLYGSSSLSEKQRMVEAAERRMQEQRQQQMEAELKLKLLLIQAQLLLKEAEMLQLDEINQRDNETKILVALILALSNIDSSVALASGFQGEPISPISEKDRMLLNQKIKEHEDNMLMQRDKLKFEKEKLEALERMSKYKNNTSN